MYIYYYFIQVQAMFVKLHIIQIRKFDIFYNTFIEKLINETIALCEMKL